MKFVRWLGAFGKNAPLNQSATWEISQVDRQVAAEPLIRGKSFISHAKIGLVIDNPEATFARGWLNDAYTIIDESGMIKATRERKNEYKNMDRFLKALNKSDKARNHHAEAAFNAPLYSAVVVKQDATARGKRRAQRLAASLNLPLRIL